LSLTIVTLDGDTAAWDAAFATLPPRQRDVYFSTAYLLICQRNGGGRACGALFEDGDTRILYPFLRRDLATAGIPSGDWSGLSDLQTPYGYGGPLVSGPRDGRVLERFRQAFGAWCRKNGVVSEFVRFHPLLDTHVGLEPHLEVVRANTTVWCRIGLPPDEALRALASSTRRGLRAARDAGLQVAIEDSDEAYARFVDLYRATMVRRQATESYFFGDAYFADFRTLLGPAQALICVRIGATIVAAALLMRSADLVHYHLGGSDAGALPLRPNNLLLFAALESEWSRGASAFHLGGGFRDGDELFRFKAGFSPERAEFHIGRAVHLPAEYERAVRAHEADGPIDDPTWFPAYRAPLRLG
jgi:hypothetical protein